MPSTDVQNDKSSRIRKSGHRTIPARDDEAVTSEAASDSAKSQGIAAMIPEMDQGPLAVGESPKPDGSLKAKPSFLRRYAPLLPAIAVAMLAILTVATPIEKRTATPALVAFPLMFITVVWLFVLLIRR